MLVLIYNNSLIIYCSIYTNIIHTDLKVFFFNGYNFNSFQAIDINIIDESNHPEPWNKLNQALNTSRRYLILIMAGNAKYLL